MSKLRCGSKTRGPAVRLTRAKALSFSLAVGWVEGGQERHSMRRRFLGWIAPGLTVLAALAGCVSQPAHTNMDQSCDLLLRGGTIYDGGGGRSYIGDVAIRG